MSGQPSMTSSVLAAVALAWLGTVAAAHADDRPGRRAEERRWVQEAPGAPREWQDRRHRPGPFGGERHDGWRAQPPQGEPWGWQQGPQERPGRRRGGDVPPPRAVPYVREAPPPQWQPPPAPSGPPPQWQAPPPQWQAPPPRWRPQAPRLRPGDQLPPEYRQRQFIVNDWRAHRLYAPPPGYQWVQPEPGSYLLIGRNGEIVNLLVGQ